MFLYNNQSVLVFIVPCEIKKICMAWDSVEDIHGQTHTHSNRFADVYIKQYMF